MPSRCHKCGRRNSGFRNSKREKQPNQNCGRRLSQDGSDIRGVFLQTQRRRRCLFFVTQLTRANDVVCNCDDGKSLRLHPKQTSLTKAVFPVTSRWKVSYCLQLNNLTSSPPPPVPGPVDAVRAVLAVVRGHVQLLFFRQRLCLHPRCLVHRPLPDGIPRRALADRRQDGASVDVRVAGTRTKLDPNTRWPRPPSWHHRKASGFLGGNVDTHIKNSPTHVCMESTEAARVLRCGEGFKGWAQG